MFQDIKIKSCIIAALSSIFLAFGLYHVHSLSGVTEGGLLGLNLLLEHWFQISPSITNYVFSAVSYLAGFRLLGKTFLVYSAVATTTFSVAYKILEQFEPLWPQLYQMPLLASILGALFVGIGTGCCVRVGGAICGDDALAMCLSHVTHWNVEVIYLISDVLVLTLSITYIPLNRIIYSFLTVILSGQIIGLVQKIRLPDSGNRKKRSKA